MLENAILYRIDAAWLADIEVASKGFERLLYEPIGPTQDQAIGWTQPRGEENGAMIESVGGQWIAKWVVEKKDIPASVVNRKLAKRMAEIEEREGRRVGRAEKKELKEEIRFDLLPHAFPKIKNVWVWIDPVANLLVIDSTSQAHADMIVTALVDASPGFAVHMLRTNTNACAAMAHWLHTHEAPEDFSIDRETELQACDESKAVVRYANHPLDIAEIREHIDQGKLPVKLAMTFDDRVSFVLTDGLQLRGIEFLDAVAEDHKTDDAGFDADVAIATGELRALLPALVHSLGGEPKPEAAQ